MQDCNSGQHSGSDHCHFSARRCSVQTPVRLSSQNPQISMLVPCIASSHKAVKIMDEAWTSGGLFIGTVSVMHCQPGRQGFSSFWLHICNSFDLPLNFIIKPKASNPTPLCIFCQVETGTTTLPLTVW